MIIHRCLNCDKLSPNRIAGDDCEYTVMTILKESINIDKFIVSKIKNIKLEPITATNINEAYIALLGNNYNKYIY